MAVLVSGRAPGIVAHDPGILPAPGGVDHVTDLVASRRHRAQMIDVIVAGRDRRPSGPSIVSHGSHCERASTVHAARVDEVNVFLNGPACRSFVDALARGAQT